MVKNFIALRPPLVKMLLLSFSSSYVTCGTCMFTYKWDCKHVNRDPNSFLSTPCEPQGKKKYLSVASCSWARIFIIHQAFYSLFTLVWQHSSFQLTNSLVNYDRVINNK